MSRRSRILDGPQGRSIDRAILEAMAEVESAQRPVTFDEFFEEKVAQVSAATGLTREELLRDVSLSPGAIVPFPSAEHELRFMPVREREMPYRHLLDELEAADDARDLQPARFAGDA